MLFRKLFYTMHVFLIGSALLVINGCATKNVSAGVDPKHSYAFVKNPDPITDPLTFVKQIRLTGHRSMIAANLYYSPFIKNGNWMEIPGKNGYKEIVFSGEFDLPKHIGFEGALGKRVTRRDIAIQETYGSRLSLKLTFTYSESENTYKLTPQITYSGRIGLQPTYTIKEKLLAPLDKRQPLGWITGTLSLTEDTI